MKAINKKENYKFHFIQQGGLVQAQINTIDDVLNLDKLDPKLWTILACPVKGLEFSEETLSLLDTDKNGRVRVPEILDAVKYIKNYLADPSVIMTDGESIPLNALGTMEFDCGHSPLTSAKAVLEVRGKQDATEISLADIPTDAGMFSPAILNGDGVVPPEACTDEASASVIKDIIDFTGGADDVSGVKGITREQFDEFFASIKTANDWRVQAASDAECSEIFFLKEKTDAAAASYMQVCDKINDYFLRCSLASYDASSSEILDTEKNALYMTEGKLSSIDQIALMPLSAIAAGKALPLDCTLNPAWKDKMEQFKKNVLENITKQNLEELTETHWRKIESLFAPYVAWFNARPVNDAMNIPVERITEILSGNSETVINGLFNREEEQPPVASASAELKKLLLLRRDFVKLLRNFVNFEDFYSNDKKAIFQAGSLFLDGRACDLCIKVEDVAKHSTMAVRSSCYLIYCDCQKHDDSGKKMTVVALMSEGNIDNIIVGRNGIFFDRNGDDWDAVVTKIIENPVSIKQAFLMPYKKLGRMITDRINKMANDADAKAAAKMQNAVNDPKAAANTMASQPAPAKKTDIGSVAAISIAVTGIATIVGSVIAFLTKKWYMPFIGVGGALLLISLPSMIIAAIKLRGRNITSVLDACGWAVNGNIKVTFPLARMLTHVAKLPLNAKFSKKDPLANKKFPWKRVIFCIILLALIGFFCYCQFWNTELLDGTPVELIKGLLNKD